MKTPICLAAICCISLSGCSSSSSDSGETALLDQSEVSDEVELDLAEQTEMLSDQIVGSFRFDTENGCFETIVFSDDNSLEIIDAGEIQTGTYSVGELIPESGLYPLNINIDTDNQEPGCDGETDSSAGSAFSFFIEPRDEFFDVRISLDSDSVFTYQRYIQITDFPSEDIFERQLITVDGNFLVLSEGGTISGNWGESNVAGEWESRDGLWCREYSEFFIDSFVGVEECQLWERSGNVIRGIRDEGNGTSFFFSIQEQE